MRRPIKNTAIVLLATLALTNTVNAAELYAHARARLLAKGLKPAPIPRGPNSPCGAEGEGDLCKKFPELVSCSGMGATSNTCRMAFVAPDGRFYVVSTYGWEDPSKMTFTAGTWANATDTRTIKDSITRGQQ